MKSKRKLKGDALKNFEALKAFNINKEKVLSGITESKLKAMTLAQIKEIAKKCNIAPYIHKNQKETKELYLGCILPM